MSDCNVNEIMAAAGCYACLTPEQLEVIQTELLCRIYTNGGGGGTPGGLDQQVQFNDAGAFGGDAGLTYNKTTNLLTVGDLAVSSLTAGSVLFSGAAGAVSQDNANLFWDDTLNSLGIGTILPKESIHTTGAFAVLGQATNAIASSITIDYSAGGPSGRLICRGADNATRGQFTFRQEAANGGLALRTMFLYENGSVGLGAPADSAPLFFIYKPNGNVAIGQLVSTDPGAKLAIKNAAAADIGQIIKLAAVPTGDALRVTSSADAVLMKIDSTGSVLLPNGNSANPALAFTGFISTGLFKGTHDGGVAALLSIVGTPRLAADQAGVTIRGHLGFDASLADGSSSTDLFLLRDAANILAQVNGTNAQTHRIYGTTTGPLYLSMSHDGTNGIIDVNSATQLRIGATASAVAIDSPLMIGGVATINQVTKILQGSDTNDFASVAAGAESAVKTVTITGAVAGDPVFIGLPDAASTPNISWTVWVSAANSVSYKFYNRNVALAVDLGNLTYKFFVHQL